MMVEKTGENEKRNPGDDTLGSHEMAPLSLGRETGPQGGLTPTVIG
jgi:hypothetical protein